MKNINFDTIYSILESSFEPFLHRGYERQKNLLHKDNYNIITYEENNEILGFLSYWELDKNMLFVEHFAVNPKKRGSGIGKKIFNDFLSLEGDKFLEVEPPHTEIDKKRIDLYKSFGFVFNENEYYQSVYNKGDSKTRLHIMSSREIDEKTFNTVATKIHSLENNI
ncbi:GNAT family N-acetyltransferase [uncultured Tyzzerella sp.]|uniref:GNAT family N-acetyltransferase n=1 Tax=uncultured Tyzzerella sp. TaxID=2321398 RepID=UPI002941CD16|nr:GNAT family N-acetyltransferase [uncultured Tyzzerella sp.]